MLGVGFLLRKMRLASSQESVEHKINLLRQWDSGSYFLKFSSHRLAMRIKIEKIRVRSPTRLATTIA